MPMSASPASQPATSGGTSAPTPDEHTTLLDTYVTYCALEGIPAFPPSANGLCLWIASLGDAGHTKTATIKLYPTAQRSCCVGLGTANL